MILAAVYPTIHHKFSRLYSEVLDAEFEIDSPEAQLHDSVLRVAFRI